MHVTTLGPAVADREGRKQSQSTGRPVNNKEDDEEVLDERLLLDGHGHELAKFGHNSRLFGELEEFQ